MDTFITWFTFAVVYGTILSISACGEIINEKAGHLNLGIPGIMYLSGVVSYIATKAYEGAVEEPLVIVIILLKPRKKAEPPVYGPGPDLGGYPGGSTAGVPGGSGYEPAGGFDYVGKPEAGTTVLGGGAADTTVLSGDSNATTVLSGGGNFGTLTRTKTNERVTISREQFKIGRERSRVDYCINDNPAVGRLHAIILNRNGSTYVVDQNSTNCTFVNSVRASANQEVRLNNGDKVTFADEEFTYNAF